MSQVDDGGVSAFARAIQEKAGRVEGEEPVEADAPVVEVPEPEAPEAPAAPEPPAEPEPVLEEPATAEEAADQAEEELPADATDEEIEAARAQAEQDFYVGRYKTREDAERGLREKDLAIQRAFTEAAELRRKLASAEEQKAAEGDEPVVDTIAWSQWAAQQVESALADDGESFNAQQAEQAALQALETGGYEGYDILLREWMKVDPASAVPFNNQMLLERQMLLARAAAAPLVEENDQLRTGDEQTAAREYVKSKFADYEEREPRMSAYAREVAPPEERAWLIGLANGDVEDKARALEWLYLKAGEMSADSQVEARLEEARQRDLAARRAKVGATVASSEATATRTPLPEAERKKNDYLNERLQHLGLPLRDVG